MVTSGIWTQNGITGRHGTQIFEHVRARVRRDLAYATLESLLRRQRRVLALDVPGGD